MASKKDKKAAAKAAQAVKLQVAVAKKASLRVYAIVIILAIVISLLTVNFSKIKPVAQSTITKVVNVVKKVIPDKKVEEAEETEEEETE